MSTKHKFQAATLDDISILSTVTLDSSVNYNRKFVKVNFKIPSLPDLNLLGRPAIHLLNISLDKLMKKIVQKIQKLIKFLII